MNGLGILAEWQKWVFPGILWGRQPRNFIIALLNLLDRSLICESNHQVYEETAVPWAGSDKPAVISLPP